MSSLLVVQPYVPSYRVAFFERLSARLEQEGVHLTVCSGQAEGTQQRRSDRSSVPGMVETKTRRLHIGPSQLRWQGTLQLSKNYDAVVYEASGGLLDPSLALLAGRRVGLWGHIGAFVKDAKRADCIIESWQLRRAAAVFAYTRDGRTAALEQGADPLTTVVLNNTFDTAPLQEAMRTVDRSRADDDFGTAGWDRMRTFAFLGGLDESKRLGFLAEVLDGLWLSHPDCRLLVAGQGDAGPLQRAVDREQVRLVGRVDDEGKAELARTSGAILMPGRVGLVVVDSFVLGLPIITTSWPHHAPEFAFLEPGVDSIQTNDTVEAYLGEIRALLDHPDRLRELQEAAARKSGLPSLDEMVENFVDGVRHLLRLPQSG